jgi:hypothetical protein
MWDKVIARNGMLALVIVLATAAFAIGAGLEKSESHEQPAAQAAHSEGGEEEFAEGAHSEAPEVREEEAKENEELLGIDVESTPLVILAVIGSLALAAAVWLRPGLRHLVLFVSISMLAFAVLDIREVFNQTDESNEGFAALAAVVALLHLSAAGLAFTAERRDDMLAAP